MSGQQRTFQPTQADYARAQAIINQLVELSARASANGGSCIPEINVTIPTDADLKAYAILQHSGHGECQETHGGWIFKYRPKGGQPGQPLVPKDQFRDAVGRRSGFWDIFAAAQKNDR